MGQLDVATPATDAKINAIRDTLTAERQSAWAAAVRTEADGKLLGDSLAETLAFFFSLGIHSAIQTVVDARPSPAELEAYFYEHEV